MTLPERPFRHPIARAIVEQRRRLIAEAEDAVDEVADKLLRLSARIEMYDEDMIVTLGLVTAGRRLMLSETDPETLPEVVKLLWDTALRVEEGELALVEQRLRRLQKELQERLPTTPDDEIERLMNEAARDAGRVRRQLAERIQRDFENGIHSAAARPGFDGLTRDDLQNLVTRPSSSRIRRRSAPRPARRAAADPREPAGEPDAGTRGRIERGGQMMRDMES
jgi:hypothetical protein